MSRELRGLARELRPVPQRRRSPVWALAGWIVRFLPELVIVGVLVWAWCRLTATVGTTNTGLMCGGAVAVSIAIPAGRRMWLSAVGCVITRTRLRTGLIALRLLTYRGRLPVVLWLRPTPVGERVWLWCRAGVSPEDIAEETDGLRAACFAREVRITRDRRWSALVAVDVVRRDPLASSRTVPSPLSSPSTQRRYRRRNEHA